MIAIGQFDQERHDRKQKDAVAAEYQRGRRRRLAPKHGKRQSGTHIADVAVGAREPRQRRFPKRYPADELPGDHGQDKGGDGSKGGRDQEWRVIEFRERRLGHDAEQQRRQRYVEQEEVHPGEAGFRQPLGFTAGEANEDQAEIRQRKIEDVYHGKGLFGAPRHPTRQPKRRLIRTLSP